PRSCLLAGLALPCTVTPDEEDCSEPGISLLSVRGQIAAGRRHPSGGRVRCGRSRWQEWLYAFQTTALPPSDDLRNTRQRAPRPELDWTSALDRMKHCPRSCHFP